MSNQNFFPKGKASLGSFSTQQAVMVGVLVLLISFALNSFVIVESGHVGVVRTLGAVQPEPLAEGFHLKKPFLDRIEQMDIRLARTQSEAASSSKDLQTVQTQVTVQFYLSGAIAPQTYQKIGQRRIIAATLIEPAIQESVKAITAQYTAEQLVTQRPEVKLRIQEAIDNFIAITLREKEVVGALQLANVAITDFAFSTEFNKAIELKVKAEQEALQAKNEKIRRVTQAEAAAAEKKLHADAVAYETEVESKARADAIVREAKALKNNPELIQLRTIETWNGELPRFTGDNAVPFINADALIKNK